MSILRAPRPAQNFTITSNEVLFDARLKPAALGVLVRLLARPDNWRTNAEALAAEFGIGRDAMRTILRELTDAGYLALEKARGDGGLIESRWVVFDTPQLKKPIDQPGTDLPAPAEPAAGFPGPLTSTEEQVLNTPHSPPPKGRRKGRGQTLDEWLASCSAAGVKAIPDDDTIFDWAERVGLTRDHLAIAWYEFKRVYRGRLDGLGRPHTQADWRAHFRNAVRRNWFKLWWMRQNTGDVGLTTQGEAARREMEAASDC